MIWAQSKSMPKLEVSNTGLVRFCGTKKLVRANENGGGYSYVVSLGKRMYIHRLVYETFTGPLIEGLVVMHLDDDKSNNHVDNLHQGTQLENVHMGFNNRSSVIVPKHRQAKYSDPELQALEDLPPAHVHEAGEPRRTRHDVEEWQLMQQELGLEVEDA